MKSEPLDGGLGRLWRSTPAATGLTAAPRRRSGKARQPLDACGSAVDRPILRPAMFPTGWLLKPGVDYSQDMIRTVEAIVDENGQVRLSEPIQLSRSQRALVTILDEEPLPQLHEDSLLSEQALAEDWNRPEEDAAWSHLGEVR